MMLLLLVFNIYSYSITISISITMYAFYQTEVQVISKENDIDSLQILKTRVFLRYIVGIKVLPNQIQI